MRTLKFIVDGQTIRKDPECDFDGLVPGTKSYVQAKFSFSEEWDGCTKVAAFYSNLGREFPPQVLNRDRACIIPQEALEKSIFKIRVIGQKKEYRIGTNKVTVHQKGGSV